MTNMNSENQKELFGHPVGLYVLFFTELWERFSYYGMRAILVLFIYSSIENGGLGWTKGEALELYGWYTMLVYVMSIPGGILADKLLGQKRTVMLGGLLLVCGHGVLAIEAMWAFYLGLGLIVLGVGCLKPNISTMVGGLYKQGDERRDKGFTIFYIGINIGAFLAALIVGYVGENIGWHYGFGLAGIGMLIGQGVYMWGQKYLVGVGDFLGNSTAENKALMDKPLTKIEIDRMIVLFISFLIIIVFWGAFEQAGGLLNIYAKEKTDLTIGLLGFTVPASWFQSVNAFFIIVFGTTVAGYWINRKRKGKEVSSLFKMAVGTIIMGSGFLLMAGASQEAGAEAYGKASMIWLVAAYLLHTIGELCASPVALSFITKLAPVKYGAIMMGVYFAATGIGNKLAGIIGEASQAEAVEIRLNADPSLVTPYLAADTLLAKDMDFTLKANIYQENGKVVLMNNQTGGERDFSSFIELDSKAQSILKGMLEDENATKDNQQHAIIRLGKDVEAKKIKSNAGDGKNYSGVIEIFEVQNKREFNTFLFITGLTVLFGLLIIVFLKRLKALTHGAEELELDAGGH
ncbi:MAG: peptide MFS transporter [Saprospiraceae bacterium]